MKEKQSRNNSSTMKESWFLLKHIHNNLTCIFKLFCRNKDIPTQEEDGGMSWTGWSQKVDG